MYFHFGLVVRLFRIKEFQPEKQIKYPREAQNTAYLVDYFGQHAQNPGLACQNLVKLDIETMSSSRYIVSIRQVWVICTLVKKTNTQTNKTSHIHFLSSRVSQKLPINYAG